MLDRRKLLALAAVTGAGALFVPRGLIAAAFDPRTSPLAGKLFYTYDSPGPWAAKRKGHVPELSLDGKDLYAFTPHEMAGYDHYIIKHTVFDQDFNQVGETAFNPANDKPESKTEIGVLSGMVYVVSLCNVHGAWLNSIEL